MQRSNRVLDRAGVNTTAVRIFLIAIPCLMLDSQSLSSGFNITLSNILLSIAFIMIVAVDFLGRSKRGLQRPHVKAPSLVFAGILFVSGLATVFWARYPDIVIRQLITILGCVMVLFLTQHIGASGLTVKRMSQYYLFGGLVCAVLGILQSVLASYYGIFVGRVYTTVGSERLSLARACSTWNDPNIFGLFLVPVIPLSMALIRNRPLKTVVIAVTGMGLALSYSRTAWVALVVAMAIFGVLHAVVLPARFRRRKILYLGLVSIGTLGILFSGALIKNEVWSRIVNLNPDSYYGRLEISQYGLMSLRDSGYMGIGPGNFVPETRLLTHNSFLGVAIEFGIIGVLAWALLLTYAAMTCLRSILRNRGSTSTSLNIAVLAVTGGLIAGSLAIEMHTVKFYWLFMTMAIAAGSAAPRALRRRTVGMKNRALSAMDAAVQATVESERSF